MLLPLTLLLLLSFSLQAGLFCLLMTGLSPFLISQCLLLTFFGLLGLLGPLRVAHVDLEVCVGDLSPVLGWHINMKKKGKGKMGEEILAVEMHLICGPFSLRYNPIAV
ncbi:hypothetical protein F5141DRAFT_1064198 [Pisolithus sp. B1]|nr:hypothetical protein F5141DRAFT_1064198 [Pisolithus sp. B1]